MILSNNFDLIPLQHITQPLKFVARLKKTIKLDLNNSEFLIDSETGEISVREVVQLISNTMITLRILMIADSKNKSDTVISESESILENSENILKKSNLYRNLSDNSRSKLDKAIRKVLRAKSEVFRLERLENLHRQRLESTQGELPSEMVSDTITLPLEETRKSLIKAQARVVEREKLLDDFCESQIEEHDWVNPNNLLSDKLTLSLMNSLVSEHFEKIQVFSLN